MSKSADYLSFNRIQVVLSTFFVLFVTSTLQADGGVYRKWSDKSGKFSVIAKLVAVEGTSVVLKRKETDESIAIPLSKLSQEDIDYLKIVEKKNEGRN